VTDYARFLAEVEQDLAIGAAERSEILEELRGHIEDAAAAFQAAGGQRLFQHADLHRARRPLSQHVVHKSPGGILFAVDDNPHVVAGVVLMQKLPQRTL